MILEVFHRGIVALHLPPRPLVPLCIVLPVELWDGSSPMDLRSIASLSSLSNGDYTLLFVFS
jgi:hypothetical protein